MASLIDVSALTLNTEEAKEIAKLIIEKGFVGGVLADSHEIETGVEHNKQIVFAGQLGDGLKASSGCTPNAGSGVVMTEKVWTPKVFDVRYQHCADDMNALTKLFRKASKMNPDFYNRIDSEEMGLIYALVEQMLRTQLPKKVWFSDTTAQVHGSGGDFTTGTDLDLFNVFDGLFKQIFASASPRVTVSENSGVSYVLQALPTDSALVYFTEMVNKADSRLIETGEARIYATRSMVDNYRDTLRTKTLGAGFLETTENGKTMLIFDGYVVETRYDWDRVIKADQDNGTVYNLPHRAILTTPSNIPVGTLAVEDLETLDSFYDRTLKSNITDIAFSLDAKHLEDYMTVAVY